MSDRSATTQGRSSQIRPDREIVASVALACFSVASLASFVRVYDGWDFIGVTFGAALSVHMFSLILRLLRAQGWLAVLLLPIFGAWIFCLMQFPSTLRFGLPTGATWTEIRSSLDQVVAEFPTAVAPVPMTAAWLSVAVASAVLIAVVAELFAFPARAIGESLAPGAFVFVLIAALGDERLRMELTLALIVTGVVAVAVLGWHHDRTVRLGAGRPALASVGPTVLVVAIAVAASAGWIGPRLPGAGAEPVIDPTTGGGRSVTTIVSPMVEIRSRLTNQSRVELFGITSSTASYWRSTTLPEFDGKSFRLPARELEEVDEPDTEIQNPNLQSIRILALADRTVPAAAEPEQADGVSASGDSIRLRINRDTSTLIAPDDLGRGDTFTVVSSIETPTAAALRATTARVDTDPIYLSVPDDLPSIVTSLAAEVTQGEPSDYDKLLALQNWFRSDFAYSLEIEPGHNLSAIEQFLTVKKGYCEQFSATFAAMARTLGMPSRVAVGFTSGEAAGEGSYLVRGANAHAWPEVYFAGIGWVPFEPTPGRGIPGAEEYTGVEAPEEAGTAPDPPSSTTPPSTPSQGTAPPKPTPVTAPPTGTVPTGAASDAGGGSAGGGGWKWMLLVAVAILVVIATPPLLRRVRRTRDHHLPPAEAAISAWRRSQRAARRAGAVVTASSTTTEWVRATAAVVPVAARPMRALGEAADIATYGPEGQYDRIEPDAVSRWADQIEGITEDALTSRQRIRGWFRVR